MKTAAQSTLEYCVMIAVIVAALMAMTVYVKRSLQGRMRAVADQISYEGTYSPKSTLGTVEAERTITENSRTFTERYTGDIMKSLPEAYGKAADATVKKEGTDKALAIIKDWESSVLIDKSSAKKNITHSEMTVDQKMQKDEIVVDVPAGG